jgi:hypothetical protein
MAIGTEPITQSLTNVWPEPNNGLTGRLRIEFEDLEPGLRHAVYLELKNQSLKPITVSNQPKVRAELFDSAGKPAAPSGISISGPIPDPQWATIPRDAYLGFRIDMQTAGVPTRERGMALIAVGGKGWKLMAGEYVLMASIVFEKESDVQNQWVGVLQLPPARFVVTAEMVTTR